GPTVRYGLDLVLVVDEPTGNGNGPSICGIFAQYDVIGDVPPLRRGLEVPGNPSLGEAEERAAVIDRVDVTTLDEPCLVGIRIARNVVRPNRSRATCV